MDVWLKFHRVFWFGSEFFYRLEHKGFKHIDFIPCQGGFSLKMQSIFDIGSDVNVKLDSGYSRLYDYDKYSVCEKSYSVKSGMDINVFAWGLSAIAAAGICLVLVFIKPIRKQANNSTPPLGIIIESAQIDGQDASISIFESDEPKMTFIWLDSPGG